MPHEHDYLIEQLDFTYTKENSAILCFIHPIKEFKELLIFKPRFRRSYNSFVISEEYKSFLEDKKEKIEGISFHYFYNSVYSIC